MPLPAPETPFLPYRVPRDRVPVCTHIRSTLIGSSILALKRHGLSDRYLRHMPPGSPHHDTILYGVAGQWLPIEVGLAHYTACDAMSLTPDECATVGASVAALAQKAMFSFVLRVATESGVTPWTAIAKGQDFWERSYQGSAIAAFKQGPKECRVETVANPLAAIGYWRSSFRGILGALVGAFCHHGFVRERPWKQSEPMVAGYQLSWV